MANAGKIMIMPKGAYDASASYEVLDLVTHKGNVWVAKRNVTGVEPNSENSADWFLMADLANYLPLSGGTLSKNGITPLTLANTSDNANVAMKFINAGGAGYLGFRYGNACAFDGDFSNCYYLFHEGNKPSGSYTGNGSSTIREMNVGGIGSSIRITGNGYVTIISYGNGFSVKGDGTVKGFTGVDCYFDNGAFAISTTHEALNANGVVYGYQVL